MNPIAFGSAIRRHDQFIQRAAQGLFDREAKHAREFGIDARDLVTRIQNGDRFWSALHQLIQVRLLDDWVVFPPGGDLLHQRPGIAHRRRRAATERVFQVLGAHEPGGLSGLGDVLTHSGFPLERTATNLKIHSAYQKVTEVIRDRARLRGG